MRGGVEEWSDECGRHNRCIEAHADAGEAAFGSVGDAAGRAAGELG
jgi:hypothetical protein